MSFVPVSSVGVASNDHTSVRSHPSTTAYRPSGETATAFAGAPITEPMTVVSPLASTSFTPIDVAATVLPSVADAACDARPAPITDNIWSPSAPAATSRLLLSPVRTAPSDEHAASTTSNETAVEVPRTVSDAAGPPPSSSDVIPVA